MLTHDDDLAALKIIEQRELSRELKTYFQEHNLLSGSNELPTEVTKRVENALARSREKHNRFSAMAWGRKRAQAIRKAVLE